MMDDIACKYMQTDIHNNNNKKKKQQKRCKEASRPFYYVIWE